MGRGDRRELWNRESGKYVARAMALAEFPLPPTCLPRPGDWVLDAGCGAGNHLGMYRLITSTVFGVDLSDAMSRAAARHAVTVQGDVQLLPFRGAAFDYVSSHVVISHVPDSRAALAELARVTKAGGRLLLVVPNRWSFITPMRVLLVRLGKYTLGSCRHYTVGTLRAEGRAHGLRVVCAAAVQKLPTAPSRLRAVPAWLGYCLDEAVRRVYTLWGGDLAVLFEKHGAG